MALAKPRTMVSRIPIAKNKEKNEKANAMLAGATKSRIQKRNSQDARKARIPVRAAVRKSFANAPPTKPAMTVSCQIVVTWNNVAKAKVMKKHGTRFCFCMLSPWDKV